MDKFINPFSDYGWKKIFGSEVSKDLIISSLNEVIQQEVIIEIFLRQGVVLRLVCHPATIHDRKGKARKRTG